MSTSDHSTLERFPFKVHTTDPNVKFTIFNGVGLEVAVSDQLDKSLSLKLPKGLYTIRSDRMGQIEDMVVRHNKPNEYYPEQPPYYSSIPLSGAVTSYEYYTNACIKYSRELTSPPIGGGSHDAGLFIFIRASQAERFQGDTLNSLITIKDLNGQDIITLDVDNSASDERDGWLAFSAKADSGPYIVTLRLGDTTRDVALFLSRNWQTQIFFTYDNILLPQSMCVFLDRLGKGFSPNNKILRAVDISLIGLQNNINGLPVDVMHGVLRGQFDNPMLGLLVAHCLLRNKKTESKLLATLIDNLEHLIGDSPDLRAIRLLKAELLGEPFKELEFLFPPMLRAGTEAVIRHSIEDAPLFLNQGFLEKISTRIEVDTPWTMWNSVVAEQDNWVQIEIAESLGQQAKQDQFANFKKIIPNAHQEHFLGLGEINYSSIARSLQIPITQVYKGVENILATIVQTKYPETINVNYVANKYLNRQEKRLSRQGQYKQHIALEDIPTMSAKETNTGLVMVIAELEKIKKEDAKIGVFHGVIERKIPSPAKLHCN